MKRLVVGRIKFGNWTYTPLEKLMVARGYKRDRDLVELRRAVREYLHLQLADYSSFDPKTIVAWNKTCNKLWAKLKKVSGFRFGPDKNVHRKG